MKVGKNLPMMGSTFELYGDQALPMTYSNVPLRLHIATHLMAEMDIGNSVNSPENVAKLSLLYADALIEMHNKTCGEE